MDVDCSFDATNFYPRNILFYNTFVPYNIKSNDLRRRIIIILINPVFVRGSLIVKGEK